MTDPLTRLTPKLCAERLQAGTAVLIDIREVDEFVRRRVHGALSHPLSNFGTAPIRRDAGQSAIFTCRTGMRTAANAERLAASVGDQAFVLEGGIDGWAAAGLAVVETAKAPIEIMRQVQITAGLLVLTGIALGATVHPAFYGVSAFVGAGLTFAGVTGSCTMAKLLAFMPWNRARAI